MRQFISGILLISWPVLLVAQQYIPQSSVDKRQEAIEFLQQLGDWEKHDIIAIDSSGNSAKVRVFILTQKEHWQFGSADHLESGDIREVLPTYLSALTYQVQGMDHLVCLGTASLAGYPDLERERAQRRASAMAVVIKDFWEANQKIASLPDIRTLNLGKYYGKNVQIDESTQRPVILLGVKMQSDSFDLQQGLYGGLQNVAELLVIDIGDYQDFIVGVP